MRLCLFYFKIIVYVGMSNKSIKYSFLRMICVTFVYTKLFSMFIAHLRFSSWALWFESWNDKLVTLQFQKIIWKKKNLTHLYLIWRTTQHRKTEEKSSNSKKKMTGACYQAYFNCKQCGFNYNSFNVDKHTMRGCPKCSTLNYPYREVSGHQVLLKLSFYSDSFLFVVELSQTLEFNSALKAFRLTQLVIHQRRHLLFCI